MKKIIFLSLTLLTIPFGKWGGELSAHSLTQTGIYNTSQTKGKKPFSLCKETGDTIHVSDVENCAELIAEDSKIKIKSFSLTIKFHEKFEDFDLIEGGTIPEEIVAEIVKSKTKIDYFEIKNIEALNGRFKIKDKGFKLYVK